jgi:hypothetical protein
MKRFLFLALVIALVGLCLGGLARRGAFPRTRASDLAEAAPAETTIALTWDGGGLVPARLRVARDTRVTFVVATTDTTYAGNLTIPDYGTAAPWVPVVPGSVRRVSFVTARPGDGFAITVGGRPAGRLDVTGEHLEDNRR